MVTPVMLPSNDTPTPPSPLLSAAIKPATEVPWMSNCVRGSPGLTKPFTATNKALKKLVLRSQCVACTPESQMPTRTDAPV